MRRSCLELLDRWHTSEIPGMRMNLPRRLSRQIASGGRGFRFVQYVPLYSYLPEEKVPTLLTFLTTFKFQF